MREAVEWGFKEIATQWSFLDVKHSMQIFKMHIAKYYVIGAFLCNLRSLLYENQTSVYFKMGYMGLEEYLSLTDNLN